MPASDEFTVVIVLTRALRSLEIMGDAVSDVISLLAKQIKPALQLSSAVNTDYLDGLGTIEDCMNIFSI
jgi:purine-binding chemotaxis protein CheW